MDFGQQVDNFDQVRLHALFDAAHTDAAFTAATESAQAYILSFFQHSIRPACVLVHVPTEGVIEMVKPQSLSMFLTSHDFEYSIAGNVVMKWNPYTWFMKDVIERVILSFDLKEGHTFVRRGQRYINLWHGMLHNACEKKYDEYSPGVRADVQMLRDHITSVWCGGDEASSAYVEQWLAQVAQLHKCQTLLMLKSGQGAGKSIVTDFLSEHVFGKDSTLIAEDAESIVGSYNSLLRARMLVVLEEVPATTKGQFLAFYDKLKHLVSGSTITVREKFKPDHVVPNAASFLLLTNNDVRISADDRRCVFLDVVGVKTGDHAYFARLARALNRTTGECYFQMLRDMDLSTFNDARDRPVTAAKIEHIADRLPSMVEFLKSEFVLRGKDVVGPFSLLFDQYKLWCDAARTRAVTKNAFSRALTTQIGLKTTRRRIVGRPTVCVDMSHAALLAVYQQNHWVTAVDDVEMAGDETLEEMVPVAAAAAAAAAAVME